MNSKSFMTTLFMSLAGLAFIIIAFIPIIFNIYKWFENANIENNGKQINATITSRSIMDIDDDELSRTYSIEYVVNDKKYSESIVLTEKNLKEGDTITMYYLLDNPEKIYVPLEDKGHILSIFIAFPIFSFLGYLCIKRYNIFTYNKT